MKISSSFARRQSLYICGVVAVLFLIGAGIAIQQSVKQSSDQADHNAFAQLDIISLRVENVMVSVASAVDNVAVDVLHELYRAKPDTTKLFAITRQLVEQNDIISGSIVSLPLHTLKGQEYFAAYSSRHQETGVIHTSQVGNENYDYTTMDWYSVPLQTGQPYWTDPYFDEGAGNISMCTYSRPLKDSLGHFRGVFTADLPLEWLSEMVSAIKPYKSSYNLMVSKDASYIVHHDPKRILRETIFSATSTMSDTSVVHIGREMIAGHRGSSLLQNDDTISAVFYTPISSSGWSVAMVCPLRDIYQGTLSLAITLTATLLVALLLIFLVVNFVIGKMTQPLQSFSESARLIAGGDFHAPLPKIDSKDEMMQLRESFRFMQTSLTSYIDRLKETTSAKERIESELNIAREIQMSMIPKIFPPYPERQDIDIYAFMQPAKEVGGDLYDFFLEDNKIYFAVGDVSGKGVPASLFMAVTRSIFRSIATSMGHPSAIVTAMNHAMCDGNDANMFVTLFVGIIDLSTGEMTYCNAGHNPPVLMDKAGKITFVDIANCSGLPVGVFAGFPYTEQSMNIGYGNKLILYTDGLTEAEDRKTELYGEDRLIATLSRPGFADMNVRDLLESLFADVEAHVADAPQSDDLTIMVIEFKGKARSIPVAETHSSHYRELELTNDIAQLAPMTTWLESICEDYGVSPSLTMSINLALEEAVTNVILYAYPTGKSSTFRMDFDVTDGQYATWRIIDTGMPFDPTAKADADLTLDAMERPIGGLGIFLVKEIMDDVTYSRENGQNILTLHINLKKQQL